MSKKATKKSGGLQTIAENTLLTISSRMFQIFMPPLIGALGWLGVQLYDKFDKKLDGLANLHISTRATLSELSGDVKALRAMEDSQRQAQSHWQDQIEGRVTYLERQKK